MIWDGEDLTGFREGRKACSSGPLAGVDPGVQQEGTQPRETYTLSHLRTPDF